MKLRHALLSFRNPGICLADPPADGGAGGGLPKDPPKDPPADPPKDPPKDPPADPPKDPPRDVLHFTKKQLEERDAAAGRKAIETLLAETGLKDEAELKSTVKVFREKDPTKAEEVWKERFATVDNAAKAREAENTKLRLKVDVMRAARETKFEDPDYALYMYEQHLSTVPEAELGKVTPKSFLEGMKAKPENARWFETTKVPANTGPKDDPPKPKSSDPPPAVDAMNMSPAEWREYKRTHGYA